METTSEVFASTPFEEQLVHPLTNSIPLLSESAIANRHLNPLHDTKHKKMIFEVQGLDNLINGVNIKEITILVGLQSNQA